MEPDKTYPLHSDDDSQTGPSATSAGDQYDSPLDMPSKDGHPNSATPAQPDSVPWYLRPLTKTTESPLTSTQTRPFVPRQPLPPVQQQSAPQSASLQPNDQSVPDDGQLPSPQPQTITVQQPFEPAMVSSVKAPPLSPFRSRPIAPSVTQLPQSSTSSADHFQMPGQSKPPVYQQALSAAAPKPFSQFDAQASKRPVTATAAPEKPKKMRKIIGIALAVLLVGGIGAGVYSLWPSNDAQTDPTSPGVVASAEDKFYRAIENHLRADGIRQVFEQTVTAADTSTFRIDATSDFSDPRVPKSLIKYELTSGDGEAAIEGGGELAVLDQNEYYGKLTKPALFFGGSEDTRPKVNQWYVATNDDTTAEMVLDPLSARASINSPLGEFPVGSFDDDTRQQLLRYVRDQNVYKILSDEQVEIDGKKTTHYTIELNIDAVNELNKRVYTALGGNTEEIPITFTENGVRRTELWVSDDTTKLVRVTTSREYKSGDSTVKEATTVNISYPNDTSAIRIPEGAIAGGWAKIEE